MWFRSRTTNPFMLLSFWLTTRKGLALLFSFISIIHVIASDNLSKPPVSIKAKNPIIWADVPDPCIIRVGDVYYMSSTTMHVNPGVPIMKSQDLVNWEIVNYVYDILAENDEQTLSNGKNEYGKGSWASSLRYHNGIFYVVFSSNACGKTFVYKTENIEKGPWTRSVLPMFHDMSLFFEDNGQVYLVHGSNNIHITELTSDVSAVKENGLDQVIIPDASSIAGTEFYVRAEGSHIHKINGKYYIFLITWPRGKGRAQLVYRADNLEGPYEGRIALSDAGIAQGGIVETPEGIWYGLLFQDHGSVGRIPYLVPVTWQDDWPVFGINGKVPQELDIPAGTGGLSGIVVSDEFDQYSDNDHLKLVWQWNHNPDNIYWSVTQRPGYLRLINGRIDTDFLSTRNTLTQRTFGPVCSANIAMDISNMKDGDCAGLGALQKKYGFVGVRIDGNSKAIVMVNSSSDTPVEVASVPVTQDNVFLKVDIDFKDRTDKAYFYYSLDGIDWKPIGNTLQMSYTLPHFMGYRFALFNYSTKNTGGFVDFDWFRIDANPAL